MKTSTPSGKSARMMSWALRLLAAGILAQTLFYKFSAAPESVYIFTKVGQEPWGRIGSGVVELIAVIFLLLPQTIAIGAGLGAGVMAGAIFFHLTTLGIEVQGDGGTLFGLAVTVLVSATALLVIFRKQLPLIGARLP